MTDITSTALLARYFERIGYSGPVEPTLAVLQQLHLLHPQSIPFENLAPYTGQRVQLGIDAIAEKMLTQRRGGYCFEHNKLFLAVLREIGFRVTPLIARVRWQVPAEVETGLTHMLLRVEIEGRSWFADVAFGSTTQTAPLELCIGVPQRTPHGMFRLVHGEGAWEELGLEFQTPAGWQAVYRFTLAPAADVDFEIGNWYTSAHPQSVFLDTLLVSRTRPGYRELMVNASYTSRDHAGNAEQHRYVDAAAWADCLHQRFGLQLAPDEARNLFLRIADKSSQAVAAELS